MLVKFLSGGEGQFRGFNATVRLVLRESIHLSLDYGPFTCHWIMVHSLDYGPVICHWIVVHSLVIGL